MKRNLARPTRSLGQHYRSRVCPGGDTYNVLDTLEHVKSILYTINNTSVRKGVGGDDGGELLEVVKKSSTTCKGKHVDLT